MKGIATIIVSLGLFFLCLHGTAAIPNPFPPKERPDSLDNIITMFNKVNIFLYLGSKSAPFTIKDSLGNNFKFRPTPQTRTGVGIVTKWFGVRLGFVLPTSNENEKKYGKTTSLDFQTNIFAKKFGLDIYFLRYRGFYLENSNSYIPSWQKSDPFPRTRGLTRSTYGANFFYIFNNNDFSQKAAFQQIEWQETSAGSFLLGAYFNATRIAAEELFIDLSSYGVSTSLDLKSMYSYTGGVSLGYSHNFIIYKKLLLNLSAMVGAGYINTGSAFLSNSRPNEDRAGFGGKFSSRIALGYSRELNYFGLFFISDTYEVNLSKSENVKFIINNFYAYYGRRFDLDRIFSKPKKSINK